MSKGFSVYGAKRIRLQRHLFRIEIVESIII